MSERCEHAGHDWVPAGGGLLICTVCPAEKWADDRHIGFGKDSKPAPPADVLSEEDE